MCVSDASVGSTLSSQLLSFSAEERPGEVHEPVQSPRGLLDRMALLFALSMWLSAVSRLLVTSQRGGTLRSSASGVRRLSALALLFWAHTLNHPSASLYPRNSLPSERR